MAILFDSRTRNHIRKNGTKLWPKTLLFIFVLTMIVILPNKASASQPNFVAGLTGNQEVPSVNTNATGSASFSPVSDSMIRYVVNVTGLSNVTEADLHIAKEGKNGPIALTLFSSKAPVTNLTGILSQGNITSANFQGPMMGKQLSNLTDLMQKGGAYVNVLTVQNPNGEIRGQLGFAGIDETGTNLGEQKVTPEFQDPVD
jgi:CHRD domain